MTSAVNYFTLHLSKEGDSVTIVSSEQNSPTFPEQKQALACKTHKEVLSFLESLKNSEIRNHLYCYHTNNTCYNGHMNTYPKGVSHLCSLENQIDFVRYRIGETTHGLRHAPLSFCVIL